MTELHPVQEMNVEPAAAVAVITALVPGLNVPLQAGPKQLTPGVLLERVPVPVPVMFAVNE